MTFFYDLNKKLADIAKKQELTESAQPVTERSTGDYSAKKARAGKDIGKPGKMFSKIAKSAGERYGSKERGEKVAGAVLAKLRAKEAIDPSLEEADDHKETKLIRDLRAQGLSDKEIVRKMKELKHGTTKTVAKEAETDESALQAYLGKKKYGDEGMKALQKAGREGAGKEKMAKIRSKYDKMDEEMADEGNEFSGELVKARAQGAKSFKVDGKEYPVKEGAKPDYIDLDKDGNRKESMKKAAADAKKKKMHEADPVGLEEKAKEPRSKGTAFDKEHMDKLRKEKESETHSRYDVKDTGYSRRYTRKEEPEAKDDEEVSDQPKKKGRPKGPAKGPERVTKGAWKHKGTRKEKTAEDLDTDGVMMNKPSNMSSEDIDIRDKGEYDREGEMAKQQMHTIMRAAKKLHSMLGDDENLPEWVQKKITLAANYIDGVSDYMASVRAEQGAEQPIAEKAVSQQQQKFMGMVHAMQKGEKIKGASPELKKVAKSMKPKDVKDFAATKHEGLPKKVKGKEEADESAEAPKASNSKGGFEFGKGIYESMDRKYKQALTEGMNVSVNMSTGPEGQPSKNITVSADGPEAEALAALLKMAGMGSHSGAESCEACGKTPCGCEEELDENSPDWPTNTETSDDAMQYSGGINGPKSTGQTTVPVIASQLRRQVSMEEGIELERSLFKLYQKYKAQ